MTELCRFAKERGIPLEFNMLGYASKRSYPAPEFWRIVAEVGNKVVLGYDAHSPQMLLRDDMADECRRMLNVCGLSTIDFEEITLRNENL